MVNVQLTKKQKALHVHIIYLFRIHDLVKFKLAKAHRRTGNGLHAYMVWVFELMI